MAVFGCRDLATRGESKEYPHSYFVLCFHGVFLLAFLCRLDALCWWDLGTECCLADFVVLLVSSLTDRLPPCYGSALTSDPSSPLPHLTLVLLRMMGDMLSYHSINLEVAGVSSVRFVGSSDIS